LNLRDRTLKIEAWNESFSSRLGIKENCYYSVHPDNPNWTLFEQDARLDITSFYGFEVVVEKVAIKAYTLNLKKGKEIIMHYINELIAEGKTFFPPFEGSVGRPRSRTQPDSLVIKGEEEATETPAVAVAVAVEVAAAAAEVEVEEIEFDEEKPVFEEVPLPPIETLEVVEDTTTKEEVEVTPEVPPLTKPAVAAVVPENIQKVVEPPPIEESKLDDTYIARYLGNLTTKEEHSLMQLRKRFQAMHLGKPPSEAVLLRFLRARDANVEKALEMLKNSLHWRRLHHVGTILESWNPPGNILEYYPGGWHHFDKEGRPVYVVRLGSMDVKGLLKTVGEDGFVKQVVTINEEGLVKCAEATNIYKKPITNWTLIVDLEKLNMRHLWRPGIRALLKIIEIVEANYPETMGQLLIVRAPKVFGVVWTLLSPFIDEHTRDKFMIYTGDDYQGPGGLVDYIPKEYIPTFLNGPCECKIQEGKPVPKKLYVYDHVGETTESSWLGTDLYQTEHVMKGSPHYVSYTVSEAESVITWDFDVIEGDCVFQVLRHKRPRDVSSQNITCLGDGTPQKPVIRPGIDAQVVEKPVTCNQGDSVQGTHICQQAGLFLLEWKYSNPVHARQSLKFHNKTKIMYYHELLPSRDFRGSMSSMCSSQSGFSQLSTACDFVVSATASTTSQSSATSSSLT